MHATAEVTSGSFLTAYGVYATATAVAGSTAVAGKFVGNVEVTGTLSKGGGSFKIDHPLDPENKYLYHSFVESPDMKNIYDGNVVLDARGEAWVELPDWFEALNQDFRYQLTPIGELSLVCVAQKIHGNRFKIAGKAGIEVSWQVTGIRKDAFAQAHRIPVEEQKSADERGLYLYPAELGKPAELGIEHAKTADRQARAALAEASNTSEHDASFETLTPAAIERARARAAEERAQRLEGAKATPAKTRTIDGH